MSKTTESTREINFRLYEVEIVAEQKGEMIKFTSHYHTVNYFGLEEMIRQAHGDVEFEVVAIY